MKNFKKVWKLGREEFNTQFFDISNNGELLVKEGNYQYNIFELVQRFSSPLEIVFPFMIEKRLSDLIQTFNYYLKDLDYHGKFYYHYPMKVNQHKEFILPLLSEGANLETGSYNELWLVRRLWEQNQFAPRIRILCNGPKTEKYLGLISELKEKNLTVIPIIEDMNEYEYLKKFKGDVGVRVSLDMRIKSHWDKKNDRYGLSADEILHLGKIRNLKVLHYHLASQITEQDDILRAAKKAISIYTKLKKENPNLDTIDIGGGLAIPYEKKKHYNVNTIIKRIITIFKKTCSEHEISTPNIICEWGRYIVAPAQITLFKVLCEKSIPKSVAKKWYIVDGSFINDMIDTWAIHQKWHIVPTNNMKIKKMSRVWLAGSSCDSDDRYTAGGSYILLPDLRETEEGAWQYLAIFDTGAYQDPLSPHHCLLSSPAKIIAQNGVITVARRRETPDEIGRLFGW